MMGSELYVIGLGLFMSLINISCGHLCLFYPEQRGGTKYNIYYPFPTAECAHHGEPCGGIAPEKPLRVFEGGKQAYVKWQQNVNVYDIGNPGYMDIAIAPFNSSNFEVLAVVHDQNAFGQFTRQNYSALIVVPNQKCEHCVLRVRYKTHRPGEPIYVQCADVSIVTTKSAAHVPVSNFPSIIKDYQELSKGFELQNRYPTRKQRADGLSLYGFAYNPYEPNRLQYVKIDLTSGVKEGIFKYDFGVDFDKKSGYLSSKRHTYVKNDAYYFVADSVLSVDLKKNHTTLLFNDGVDKDSPPLSIIEVNIRSGDISRKQPIINVPAGQAINAIFPGGDGYYTFSVREAQQGQYEFVVGQLGPAFSYEDMIKTSADINYMNFEWAELDTDDMMLYVLIGKGNISLYTYVESVPRMYKFDLDKRTFVGYYNLTAQYDYFFGRSFHYYKKTGMLYGLTAGYFGLYKYVDWNLVEIDPSNGNMTQKVALTNNAVFNPYAGGMIFGGLDQSRGVLYQVLRIADSEADVIAAVDLNSKKATFSKMTNLRHIHNMNMIPAV